jgi:hypothetical protein
MNINNFPISASPTRIVHEGRQTPPASEDALANIDSSPLPSRSRHGSVARKRTNEELYQKADTPKTSPRTTKTPRKSIGMADLPETGAYAVPKHLFQTVPSAIETKSIAGVPIFSESLSSTKFGNDIREFQQELDAEFQQFERSLEERDSAADLEDMDWHGLEARYESDIAPCIAREKEIMDDFQTRFAVLHCSRKTPGN